MLDVTITTPKFTDEQCRKALLGFCGANENALLHYLAYSAAVENEAAINSGEVPEETRIE